MDKKIPYIWYDHGVGVGGNTIDAVMFAKNWDFFEAKKFLMELNPNPAFRVDMAKLEKDRSNYVSEHKYKIDTVKDSIFSYPLKNYLSERNISLAVANKYLKEVEYYHCKFPEKSYFGLGLQNDNGNWEIRNKISKVKAGNTGITTVKNNSKNLATFEGMFDFLSFVEMNPESEKVFDFIILNSVTNVRVLEQFINDYKNVYCYLDNDKAGTDCYNAIKEMFEDSNVIDKRGEYSNYKDYNEYHQKFEQNKNIKRGI